MTTTPAEVHAIIAEAFDADHVIVADIAHAIADAVYPVTASEAIDAALIIVAYNPRIDADLIASGIRANYAEQGDIYDMVNDAIADTHDND